MPAFPPFLQEIMQRLDFHPRKRWGQNFLMDQRVVADILRAADLHPEDTVLEIGPGLGALTVALAGKVQKVFAVELDRKLCVILGEVLAPFHNVTIIPEDILHVDLQALLGDTPRERVKVVANLPYYVTTPILMYLLESRLAAASVTVMVQKEVAERMRAKPGGKTYGSLSVVVQYYTRPELIRLVPPGAFFPQPEITSAVLKLHVLPEPAVRPKDESVFFRVVRSAFGKRRKTLINALLQAPEHLWDKGQLGTALADAGIDGQRRGETLSLQEFSTLSDALGRTRKRKEEATDP